jgi:hypothetical protein
MTKQKGISVAARKQKARLLQQKVRDLILKYSPSLEPDDVKSTSMGANGEDVLLSPAARRQYPISIECKSRASWAFYKDYDQAVINAPEGMEPILVAKANHRDPVVIVSAEWFFKQFPKRIRR